MSGSALVVNQRQHVGLQQLSALAAALTRSSLGPVTRYTLVLDEASGQSTAVCSCLRLLENLEVAPGAGAVGQLTLETVRAHHKRRRSGSRCLLFLAGAWSRAALECLHRGISIPHIISSMSEGLDVCLDVCRANTVSTEELGSMPSGNWNGSIAKSQGLQLEQRKPSVERPSPASPRVQRSTPEVRNVAPGHCKIKLSHSRHFCQATADDDVASEHVDVARVARAVSRGRADAMDLVVEASLMQSKNGTSFSRSAFDVDKVVTCVLPDLSEEHACVLPGCVALLSAEQASVARRLKDRRGLRVALIDGDLCERYRHVGFNKPKTGAGGGVVSETLPAAVGRSLSKEEEWTEGVLATLLKLNVSLILLTGAADERLTQRCVGHAVLVVAKTKASVLRAFADATGAVPVSYASQLTRHCVGAGAHVTPWRDLDDGGGGDESLLAVNISSGNDTNGTAGLVTAILTSRVRAKLQALEDEFWSCAYRLHWALVDGAVLPGAGAVEMLCVRGLQTHARSKAKSDPCGDVVLALMAEGFVDYASTIVANGRGRSKAEAWTALAQRLKDSHGVPRDANDARRLSKLLSEGEVVDGDEDGPMESGEDASAAARRRRVFDNVSVKMDAWRKALDLVFIVLQTDAEVVTGIDAEAVDAQAKVSLL